MSLNFSFPKNFDLKFNFLSFEMKKSKFSFFFLELIQN